MCIINNYILCLCTDEICMCTDECVAYMQATFDNLQLTGGVHVYRRSWIEYGSALPGGETATRMNESNSAVKRISVYVSTEAKSRTGPRFTRCPILGQSWRALSD